MGLSRRRSGGLVQNVQKICKAKVGAMGKLTKLIKERGKIAKALDKLGLFSYNING